MSCTTLLIDFNNLAFRVFFAKEVGAYTVNPDFPLWRYIVFESIYKLLMKFREVNELVVAIDDKNSWRKSYFSRYKESRKKNRDKQKDIDWELLFRTMVEYTSDLKHHLPFKILKIRSAEADDIIAVLSEVHRENAMVSSNDEDYLQLSKYGTKLWNPSKRKFVECENAVKFLQTKCLTGQSKDDIFNAKTPDEWGMTEETEGKRKPGLGEKTAMKILKEGLDKWLEDNTSVQMKDIEANYKKNFKRNRILIDFDYIPPTIRNRITEQYENYNFPPPRNIYQFFKRYHMRGFIEDFTNTERRLLELY